MGEELHIPLIIVAPEIGVAGQRCSHPVDLTILYPTLLDICGLRPDPMAESASVKSLLMDSSAKWSRPAVMTYLKGNHAVRSARWRYIRYADGTEELYDHETDPHEWVNLAGLPDMSDIMSSHRACLPTTEAAQVRDLNRNDADRN